MFLSYSHKDNDWKQQLVTHLEAIRAPLDLWDETRIAPGDAWKDAIRAAIDDATVAILIISADFLSSKLVAGEEIPRLLARRHGHELRVIPIIARACQWQRIQWLEKIEVRPRCKTPLAALTAHQVDEVLSSVAGEVVDLAQVPSPRQQTGLDIAEPTHLDAVLEEALARLAGRLVKLFEEKDQQDGVARHKLNTELKEARKALTNLNDDLAQKREDSAGHKELMLRAERLNAQLRQLQARYASLLGQRALDLGPSIQEVRSTLMKDLDKTARWAQQVNFLDARKSRDLEHIYIHLDVFLYPRRIRATREEIISKIPFEQLLTHTTNHVALLGQPGAGKTTSIKRLFLTLIRQSRDAPSFTLPLVLRFRDLNSPTKDSSIIAGVLYGPLLGALRIHVDIGEKLLRDDYRPELRDYYRILVTSLLDALNATVILDGFDELVEERSRDAAIAEIRELALNLSRARLVLTSRTGDFNFSVDRMDQFEIAPLAPEQISNFATKWLGGTTQAQEFVAQVASSPFNDTTIRPLSLAHICAIYERAGSIPDKPKAVYRKVVGLLLEEWDEQRSVRRSSVYQNFTPDRKFEFLAALAFVLTTTFGTSTFNTETLTRAYRIIHPWFGLPSNDVNYVVSEIEGHTGLFLRIGYEQFEFAHKSLQEYLAAEYIVRLPEIPRDSATLCRVPNELAITVAISSDAAGYLSIIALDVFHRQQLPRAFYDVFIDRLLSEHVDLGLDSTAALALTVLVSLWSCKGGRSDAKSTPNEVSAVTLDRLCDQFTTLLRGPGRDAVERNYVECATHPSGFVEMKRIQQPKGHRLPTRLFLPKRLVRLLRQ
ncbi:TIR domain-containing protein [Sorangium sp. So ce726]|uniref:TIR domain-containing protein n=1 Tax=Sorangium sp. So ce726 TaxID=3133319 RepID=UPI003F615B25